MTGAYEWPGRSMPWMTDSAFRVFSTTATESDTGGCCAAPSCTIAAAVADGLHDPCAAMSCSWRGPYAASSSADSPICDWTAMLLTEAQPVTAVVMTVRVPMLIV